MKLLLVTVLTTVLAVTSGTEAQSKKSCDYSCLAVVEGAFCGSDGVVYPSRCTLGLAACKNSSKNITEAPIDVCSKEAAATKEPLIIMPPPNPLTPKPAPKPITPMPAPKPSATQSTKSCGFSCLAVVEGNFCGSDGVVYRSKCSLRLAACENPSKNITEAPSDVCSKPATVKPSPLFIQGE